MKTARLSLLLTAATALCPAVVHAQDSETAAPAADGSDAANGDIIVTANRREQSLLSVPIAISAVAGDALASKGITNSANLQDAVPNLQISSPYGNTQPNFSLRGISVANEYNSNQASPIGVYIDDVYMASRTSHGMGLFDLDRVEVLRGPQGTLFGRNTTGGAINFITKGPTLSGNNGYAEAGYGNYNTITAQAGIEATLIEDQLGLRIAGNYLKSDGLIDNVFAGGRDPNRQNTLQGRATLRFNPGSGPLDIKIKAYGGRDHGTQAAIHGLLTARTGLKFFEVNENRIGLNRTDAYGVAATIAYLHATYKELVLQGADIAGNDLPFAPRWTMQAGADIQFFDTGTSKLTFSPNVAYFSRQYFSPLNEVNAPGTAQQNAELQQGSYAKVNATLAWEIGRVTIKGFINNAFNRKTYAYGLDLRGAGFPYPFLVPAAPRTFGGSVRVTF